MNRTYGDIHIRETTFEDAAQLCLWWNDGKVMEHAGFPNGLGTTPEIIRDEIAEQNEKSRGHMIIYRGVPIGEMYYGEIGEKVCEIGIKICDSSLHNKGLGKVILSMFIDGLFHECGYEKIALNTNLKNKRAQHVYEQLGFEKVRTNINAWTDQLGNLQSSVDYELTKLHFVSYLSKRVCK